MHPSSMQLARYFLGRHRPAIHQHVRRCRVCKRKILALAAGSAVGLARRRFN